MQQIFNKDQAEAMKLLHFYVWKSLMAYWESATLGDTLNIRPSYGGRLKELNQISIRMLMRPDVNELVVYANAKPALTRLRSLWAEAGSFLGNETKL